MKAEILDRVGATASLLCAIHCLLLPLAFAFLPVLGVLWLNDPRIDRLFLVAALLFAGLAHPQAYLRHRRCSPSLLALAGIFGIVFAIKWWEVYPAHHYVIAFGGLAVAGSHFWNRWLCRSCRECGVHRG